MLQERGHLTAMTGDVCLFIYSFWALGVCLWLFFCRALVSDQCD